MAKERKRFYFLTFFFHKNSPLSGVVDPEEFISEPEGFIPEPEVYVMGQQQDLLSFYKLF